ncbi:ester hydrolase C11orf54 homolog [Anoplolepis gracilipes]|uniref:ester hydrolase C11orf54 homolog n=1 Tax=Anoplolepis gracilipes TaxID=354296 RepID=UPI003B9EB946
MCLTLRYELKSNFEEVTVEWVDCPDLTKEPFNLAAPGLCGDPTLVEMGGMSTLFPRPITPFTYNLKKFLETCYDDDDIFVIGASVYPRKSNGQFGELIMNTSFSKTNVYNESQQSKLLSIP